jgi:ankyrin repeat protein
MDTGTAVLRWKSVDMAAGRPMLHPLDEGSSEFRAVAALFHHWALSGAKGYGTPAVPPLGPLMLHALIGASDAFVFAAGRGGPQLAALCFDGQWSDDTLIGALNAAIAHGRIAPCEMLLRTRVDIDQNRDGQSPLRLAAKIGSPDVMRLLLRRFPKLDGPILHHLPLCTAVEYSHAECVEQLLEAGAEPGHEHVTSAIELGNERVLRSLLCYGVKVDKSILADALTYNKWHFLPMLAECVTNTTTALKLALQAKDGQMLQALLETLSDAQLQINHQHAGTTALTYAIEWGNVAVVKALLARGANPVLPRNPSVALRTPATSTYARNAVDKLLAGASLQVFPHLLTAESA